MGREIFEGSQNLRERIISSTPGTSNVEIPMTVAYLWPTKYCPIGCEHCMFASPNLSEVDRQMVLSENAVSRFIEISKKSKLESLVVSGGGEPTLEMNTIERLIKEAHFSYFEVTTGAQWTASDRLIHKYLSRFQDAINQRRFVGDRFDFSLRISIDTFHQAIVKPEWISNLVRILRADSANNLEVRKYPDISLFFRTLLVDGENTADILAKNLGADITEMKDYVREIVFKDSKPGQINKFLVFYKDMRFVGRARSAENVKKSVEFDDYFANYSKKEGDVRLGMSYLKPGSKGEALKGINVFVSYDGKMMVYGGAPDLTLNINLESNYNEYILRLMRDVVSRTLLFKGLRHVEEIAEEVDPDVKNRVERKNWLASVADESLATPELRLYVTIRLLQGEVENGELKIDDFPGFLSELIKTPKEILVDEYKRHTNDKPPTHFMYGNEKIDIIKSA